MASAFSVARRFLALVIVVLSIVVLGWASPAVAAGRSYDEAPMQFVTKGLTVEQHLQRQAELSRRLVGELPSVALEQAVRVQLTRDEIAAIDKAPRSAAPLRIGLVKAMAPGIVVAGLDPESVNRTADGGLVWARAVRADNAGAIRLHVQEMSLPPNAELYVYSRVFWTTAVFGAEAILQLRLSGPVSEADLRAVSFRVAEAGIILDTFTSGLRDPHDTPLPWQRFEKAGT